jgi:hypothetical protein
MKHTIMSRGEERQGEGEKETNPNNRVNNESSAVEWIFGETCESFRSLP